MRAVEDAASKRGYSVILCNSDEDTEKERMYIELMRAENVAGVIITPSRENDASLIATIKQEMLDPGIPVVAVDRKIKHLAVDTVLLNNIEAATNLTNCLIDSGHQEIAAIVGVPGNTTGDQRLEGYMRALKANGITVAPNLIVRVPPKIEHGYEAANQLLDLPRPPTAVFAGNNLLAIGVLKAIHARGLKIPDDVALASFDEMDWTSVLTPGLTVIEQPIYEIGRVAAELLFQRIADPSRPIQHKVLQGRLLVRGSSGPHRCFKE